MIDVRSTPGHPVSLTRLANRCLRVGLVAITVIAVIALATGVLYHATAHRNDLLHVVPNAPLLPTLASQTVYLPTDDGVYALRASDGALRWAYPAGIDGIDKTTPNVNPQSALGLAREGATLYVLATSTDSGQGQMTLTALNANDGAPRWSVSPPTMMRGSLVQVGSLLIVAALGPAQLGASPAAWTVEAYSAASGHLVWHRALASPPLAKLVASDGEIYIVTAKSLVAPDALTGAPRRSTNIIPSAYQEGTTPADANTAVALTASGNRVYVLAKRAVAQGTGATWEANVYQIDATDGTHIERAGYGNEPFDSAFAPSVSGATLIAPVFGGMMANAVGAGGAEWRFMPDSSAAQDQAMTGGSIAYGMIYATDLTGVRASAHGVTAWEDFTYAVRANDGAEMWRAPTNGGLLAEPPAVASGVVLVPCGAVLRALRASDGRSLWTYIAPSAARIGSPVVDPEVI
jgi:outer membrane protein assembly factor BamB